MAESKVPIKSRAVQELAINSDQLPEKYIYKDAHGGLSDASLPILDVPVIDLSLLASSENELEKLKSALCSWGCFQTINHGMTGSFLDDFRGLIRQFFGLPMEEKEKYSREGDDIDGYGNDAILSDNQILDWTDRLHLVIGPEDQRQLKNWPENPKDFRRILHEYSKKIEIITETVLKAMARSLNLREHCFLNQYGEQPSMKARFNFYPPCPRPDLVLGLKPHSDGSAITVVLPDNEVEGLQFLIDNEWVRIPVIPHALLINVGDQVEVMSNGVFKSPVHRVVPNSLRERISVAVFCAPRPDKEVEPIDELISDARPRLYKKIMNYEEIYFHYYQQGKRPIDAVKKI